MTEKEENRSERGGKWIGRKTKRERGKIKGKD